MASLTITQTSPVVNTVAVTQTVSPVTVEITEQITHTTVVVSPQNLTNYFGGGGDVRAALTGVAANSDTLGVFTGDIIPDNSTIKAALQELEDGIEDNTAAISTTDASVQTNSTAITNEVSARTTADSNLQSQIDSNDTDIATNASSIATNASSIADNSTNISTNASAISTNATAISDEATARATADSGLQSQIDSNDTDIASNASNIATNASSISTNATAISSNVTDIATNSTAIATNTSSISTNATDITGVSSVANSNLVLIQGLQTDLNNLPGAELEAELDPTETQLFYTDPGTFAAGTSIESILRQLLIHFQPPVMTLSGWTTDTYEHGYSWSDTDFTLAFSNSSNVDTGDTGIAAFTDSFIANGTNATITAQASQTVSFSRSGTLLVDNGSPAGQSGTSLSRTGAAKLRVSSFTDTQGESISPKEASSTVRYRYWVISNTTRIDFGSLDNTNGTALITSSSSLTGGGGADKIESALMSSVGNLSINSAGTYDYVYWIYPTAATVNQITNPLGLPIYSGDTTGDTGPAINYIGTFTLSNRYSANVSMTVLRTKNSGALGTGSYTVS